jgi:hypothetical protein
VAAIERVYPSLFMSGPVRLKARRLPTGATVWENKGVELIHLPFAVPSDPAIAPVAALVARETYDQ